MNVNWRFLAFSCRETSMAKIDKNRQFMIKRASKNDRLWVAFVDV
jgi:hypothetical protein